MSFLSKMAAGITPYVAGEQPRDKRYVKLNTNENPYPPSPKTREALSKFALENLKLYPDPNATALREAIAKVEGVGVENVFCGNGSDEVLAFCFPAFFDEDGKGACYANITYSFYEVFAQFFHIPSKIVPLCNEFELDLEQMKKTDCQGYFIANPNAPTGVGIPLDEMEKFISSVGDKIVICDEAYMDFYNQSCAALTQKYPNLLVVKTFSKSYSLAGIRCGYAVGNSALIDGLFRMKDCFNSYPVDALCQAVCRAAVLDTEYHQKTTDLVVKERTRVRDALLKLGFTVPESGANFLFAGRSKLSGKEVYTALRERGVLVRFWEKPFLKDFCRITVGSEQENDALLCALNEIFN